MFDVEFEHYLTYGATDQQTVRRLTGEFTGLMIPGTVAAFQREGTGGFALTLSATEAQTPYVIDPRFPLFQQPLDAPKKSHEALAAILGKPDLVSRRCCTNPHWPARCQSTGSSPTDAIRLWSAEGGHPIEDFTAENGLTPLPSWTPGAKAIADDGLVAENAFSARP